MVLNMVIGAALQVLSNLRPAVAVDLVVLKDLIVLFEGPLHLFNVGIEVIVPSEQGKIRLGQLELAIFAR